MNFKPEIADTATTFQLSLDQSMFGLHTQFALNAEIIGIGSLMLCYDEAQYQQIQFLL